MCVDDISISIVWVPKKNQIPCRPMLLDVDFDHYDIMIV